MLGANVYGNTSHSGKAEGEFLLLFIFYFSSFIYEWGVGWGSIHILGTVVRNGMEGRLLFYIPFGPM